MCRSLLPADRLVTIRIRATAALALAAVAVAVVLGLVPGFAPEARAQIRVPGPESFARPPQTPIELWDAVDYLVRSGQPEQAVPYLDAFLRSEPDDDALLEIRDRYGAGSILRLGDYPATRDRVEPLMEQLEGAVQRQARRADRIERFIDLLTATREEQDYGVEGLRQSGPYAVPHLVRRLSDPRLPLQERARIVTNMGRLDRSAVPALIAVLDAPDPSLVADAARALGGIGDRRAVPWLTPLAADPDAASPTREPARRAIAQITGRPFDAQPRSPVRLLTETARAYHRHEVAFPDEVVEVWVWDPDQPLNPTSRQVARTDAEEYLGLRLVRDALWLEPENQEAQIVLLSLALEKAVERVGLDAFPAHDPTGLWPLALASGPAVLDQVLIQAIADGRSALGAVTATALGHVTDRDALATTRPAPLVAALSAPDRRVQFAAARALVWLDPIEPFPGASRVVPVLARFVASQTTPRAVVVDGNAARGSQIVGYLRELGYDPLHALTGDQGFRFAAETADVELIVIEPSLVQGAWRLVDTISNLRADARTAAIPIALFGPLNLETRLASLEQNYPGLIFLVTPADASILQEQLDLALADRGVTPLSDTERQSYAQQAATLLATIATRTNTPFRAQMVLAEPALSIALNVPETSQAASVALGDVPDPAAQRSLAEVALDAGRPIELRLTAAGQLTRSIQRFGPLVAAEHERELLELLDTTDDHVLRSTLGAVIGALRPRPGLVGRRLQDYALPMPGPEPEADPEALDDR